MTRTSKPLPPRSTMRSTARPSGMTPNRSPATVASDRADIQSFDRSTCNSNARLSKSEYPDTGHDSHLKPPQSHGFHAAVLARPGQTEPIMRIVQVSDSHISRSHRYFEANNER